MLQKFGLVKDYWLETDSQKIDQGRFSITKKEEAPYFHDGSVQRLDRAAVPSNYAPPGQKPEM
jgi:cytochrome c peroxidase